MPHCRQDVRTEIKARLLAALSINSADRAIRARGCDNAQALLDRANQASAARVIGVLAEKFDPPGDKKTLLRHASGNLGNRSGALSKSTGLLPAFRAAHPGALQTLGEKFARLSRHGGGILHFLCLMGTGQAVK